MNIQTILVVAGVIYYIYSSVKGTDAPQNKKTKQHPTPTQQNPLDEILEKMLEQQNKPLEKTILTTKSEPYSKTSERNAPPKKLFQPKAKNTEAQKQGLPFEKRRSSDVREMPSRKQIERVVKREKKAAEQPIIKVRDYDTEIVDHELPHPVHHLSDNSKIKFSFKEAESETFEFDARQAIISQIILERKEY
jgi:hypothetical protein